MDSHDRGDAPRVSNEPERSARRPGRPRLSAGQAVFDRDQALHVALRVFVRDGYEGSSVRQISREVGVSNTLLHHYFGSKQQLWEACIDQCFGSISAEIMARVATLMDPTDPLACVRELIVSYVLVAAEHPEGFQIITQEGACGGERLDYIVSRHLQAFLDLARVLVEDAAKRGLVREVPWASLFFLVFSGASSRFAMREFASYVEARPEGITEREFLERHAAATADMIMAALRPTDDTSKS